MPRMSLYNENSKRVICLNIEKRNISVTKRENGAIGMLITFNKNPLKYYNAYKSMALRIKITPQVGHCT